MPFSRVTRDEEGGGAECGSVRETRAAEDAVLVELEVVMPPQTPLQLVHDVSLDLQSKVERVRICFTL